MNENNIKVSNNSNLDTNNDSQILIRKKSPNTNSNIPIAVNKRHSLNITTSPSSKLTISKREIQSPNLKLDENKTIMKSTRAVNTPVKSTTPSKFQQFRQELSKQKSNKQFLSFDDSSSTFSTNPKAFQTLLRQARINGSLNISNYELTDIPLKVLRINIDKFEGENNENDDDENGFKWWQQIDLQKLYMASNKIKAIPKDIQFLDSLVVFDIHDNQIELISDEIGFLGNLQTLNLSHNSIKTLPNDICKLRNLLIVNLAHNQLTKLPNEFGYLDYLEDLNLSHNELTEIPKSFGYFTKLRTLNLSSNKINQLLPETFYSQNLKFLDLTENQLEKIPIEAGDLINLEQLYLSKNRLKEFPFLKNCCQLKDLDCSYNLIKEIKINNLKNLIALTTLNLRENQLTVLPNDICDLKKLERLDMTNNGLLSLPPQLALIENFKQILLTGNPLRSIRKDVLSRGTDAILKSLKNQIEIPAEISNNENENSMNKNSLPIDLKIDVIKASRAFDYSFKKATEFPINYLNMLHQSTIHTINLSKNSIKTLPNDFEILDEHLTNLNYSLNQLDSLPLVVYKLKNLITLDLRGNQLSILDSSLKNLVSLRELIIADNRFVEIPDSVFNLINLENLFANNNHIKEINVKKLANLKHLSTLNLQNNDINHVPPELGKLENIKSLQLDGNSFKLPRTSILTKGTAAILEYLRGRIVNNEN